MSTQEEELLFMNLSRAFPDLSQCDANRSLILSWLQDENLPLTLDNASVAVTSLGNQLVNKPKERALEPKPVEESEQDLMRRLKRELHSKDQNVSANAKKQLVEIANRSSLAAPQPPPIPDEITADEVRNMKRLALEQLYMRHGSTAVKARLYGRG